MFRLRLEMRHRIPPAPAVIEPAVPRQYPRRRTMPAITQPSFLGCPAPAPGSGPDNGEHLAGLIERVTFFTRRTASRAQVKAKGHRDLVTVVGNLPSASPGEWLNAQGRWVQDRDFGRQFRAVWLTSTAPTTREGIEKYLGSGMVRALEPRLRKKLVERFGRRSW